MDGRTDADTFVRITRRRRRRRRTWSRRRKPEEFNMLTIANDENKNSSAFRADDISWGDDELSLRYRGRSRGYKVGKNSCKI